jgi:hypothetical protein
VITTNIKNSFGLSFRKVRCLGHLWCLHDNYENFVHIGSHNENLLMGWVHTYSNHWCNGTILIHFLLCMKILLFSSLVCRTPTLAKCGGEAQHLEKSGVGVLRDSRMFRARQQGPKHLTLGCSWCHWKGLEV